MARYLVSDKPVKFWSQGQLVDGYMYNHGTWMEGRGYFTQCSTATGTHAVGWLQLDGTFCTSQADSHWRTALFKDDRFGDPSHASGYHIQWLPSVHHLHDVLMHVGSDTHYKYVSKFTSAGKTYARSAVRVADSGTPYNMICLRDGRIATNDGDSDRYFYGWPYLTGEIWDPLPDDPDYCTITWIKEELYYVFHKHGQGAIYDHATQSIVRNDLYLDDLSSFNRCHISYCREHDIFIVICKQNLVSEPPLDSYYDSYRNYYNRQTTIRVYLNVGKPYAVSTPIALTSIQVGVVSQIEATVTGEQGEPVENQLVDWSITSGEGQLTLTQSVTGDDGKATTGYLPPATSGGDVTIEAKVTY